MIVMREGISVEVSAADCDRLAVVVADRNSPQKHVWRARIILATAEGCGTVEIMRRAGVSKPCVWRWQERFMREGVAGLLREKTRKPGMPPLPATLIERVVALTLTDPPGAAHNFRRAADLGRRQNDPRPPDMFLRAVAICDNRCQSLAVRGTHFNADPLAHDASSHTPRL